MNVMLKWLLGSVLVLSFGVAEAQNANGVLRVVKGDVQVKSAKTGQTSKAKLGMQVFPSDVIITGAESRAKIVMVDNNEINISPDSQIEIQHYEFDPAAGKKEVLLNVLYGKVRAKVEQKYDGKTTKFQVKTPAAVAGVRGTDFVTSFDKANNSSQVVTFRGKVDFGLPGPGGTITNVVSVTPGTTATSTAGKSPTPPGPVPKEQLAKMDNDSKADSGPAKSDGKSDRQPSSDKDSKKDGSKSDSSSRSPASSAPDSGSGGGSHLAAGDLPSSGPVSLPDSPPGPTMIPTGPKAPPEPPKCTNCDQLTTGSRSSNVNISINRK